LKANTRKIGKIQLELMYLNRSEFMNKDELMKKAKELLNEGNLEKVKELIEDHKDELGEYYEKAKTLLKSEKIDDLMARFKKFF